MTPHEHHEDEDRESIATLVIPFKEQPTPIQTSAVSMNEAVRIRHITTRATSPTECAPPAPSSHTSQPGQPGSMAPSTEAPEQLDIGPTTRGTVEEPLVEAEEAASQRQASRVETTTGYSPTLIGAQGHAVLSTLPAAGTFECASPAKKGRKKGHKRTGKVASPSKRDKSRLRPRSPVRSASQDAEGART